VVDELTRPLNPNKLYEYSAAGKAVVSMNYSSTIDALREIIFVGRSRAEFVSQIRSASENHQPELSLDLARGNSWDEIALNMQRTIQRELSRKQA
jgi:hypothetical protein